MENIAISTIVGTSSHIKEIIIETTNFYVSTERYIFHLYAAGIFLHINGKFTMGKLKSFLFS